MNNRTKIVIALLVLLNIVLITFLYFGKPNRRNHKAPKEIIIEKLGFDKSQIEEYKGLIIEHHNKTRSLRNDIKRSKTNLYKGIVNENSLFNDSIINIIGGKFEELEQAHYDHFLGIKDICKEDQKGKFNELSTQFHKIFAPQKRGPKRRKHKNN
jgi:hypothetical protein